MKTCGFCNYEAPNRDQYLTHIRKCVGLPPVKPFSGLRPPDGIVPMEGPPVFVILVGRADRDGSLTYCQIDSIWDSREVAYEEVQHILRCKPKSIRDRYSKSLYHPAKWEDPTGDFIEVQKHEIRIPLQIHKKP